MSLVNEILDEEDKKYSVVSLVIVVSVIWGFILMTVAIWLPSREYIIAPVSGIIIVALGGAGIKANKKTS